MSNQFGIQVFAVRDVNLRDATDEQIFAAARQAGATVITKDSDFVGLVERLGSPPQIIWITVGNTSNSALRELLTKTWPMAMELMQKGERLIELSE